MCQTHEDPRHTSLGWNCAASWTTPSFSQVRLKSSGAPCGPAVRLIWAARPASGVASARLCGSHRFRRRKRSCVAAPLAGSAGGTRGRRKMRGPPKVTDSCWLEGPGKRNGKEETLLGDARWNYYGVAISEPFYREWW